MSILWSQNQYAIVPYSSVLDTIGSQLTVMCRCTMVATQALSMFISRQTSGATPANEWWALTTSGNAPRALIGSPAGVSSAQSATALTVGVPYWLVMTYDGSTINLYQDMVLVATTTVAITILPDTTPIIINGNANGAGTTNILEFFNGTVEDLRVYNRVLTLNELSNIFNGQGRDYIVNGLVLGFMGDEQAPGSVLNTGDLLFDYSYSASHAVVTGSPSYSTRLSLSQPVQAR